VTDTRKHIEKIASGFMPARILLSACELDLFSHIARSRLTAEEIARRAGTDPAATERLLNALVALRILRKRNGRYSNTETALRHLAAGGREFLGDIMLHRVSMWESWSNLTRIVKTGQAPPHRRSKERERRFIKGMGNVGRNSARPTVKALRAHLGSVRRLLDVGGGPAVYACAFAKANSRLTVTVLDLPGPLKYARETIRAEGLTDRVRVRPGNALKVRSFGRGYDMVFMSNFIHVFKKDAAQEIIEKAARALKSGGTIAIKDFFINRNRTGPAFAALFSINMLAADAGDCYSREEVSAWLEKAGLRPSGFLKVAEHSGILLGEK